METIRNYLENMFAGLPKTPKLIRLKEDLLATMEEKYMELKENGKSENEAIGIVISEFGNIDELVNELDLTLPQDPRSAFEQEMNNDDMLTEQGVYHFLLDKKRTGLMIGLGVFLCLVGVSMMILLNDINRSIGLIAMFMFVVLAVALFIYSGRLSEKYEYLESGFSLTVSTREWLQQKQAAFGPTYTFALIAGVSLCILSPVSIFATRMFGGFALMVGVSIMLIAIGVAVFLFVYYGTINESYTFLLKAKSKQIQKVEKEDDRVIGAVAAIVWPLAVCGFLISGLIFGMWHINWIVFPIVGLLFGTFSAAYSILKGKKEA